MTSPVPHLTCSYRPIRVRYHLLYLVVVFTLFLRITSSMNGERRGTFLPSIIVYIYLPNLVSLTTVNVLYDGDG